MTSDRYHYQEQPIDPELSLPFFGKYYVIVGGTSGIGLEAAKELSLQGASLLVIGSREESGKSAVEQIKDYSYNPNTTYEFADLSSIESTIQLAQRLRALPKIDGFIYCAAPKQDEEPMTKERINRDWAVGYLAPHILLQELSGTNEKDSRFQDNALVVYVSSLSHLAGKVDLGKVTGENGKHYRSREAAYAAAKQAAVWLWKIHANGNSIENNPQFTVFDPIVAKTKRTSMQAEELPTRLVNALIRRFGFSSESSAQHLVHLAQRHVAGEKLDFYNLRGWNLPKSLYPHLEVEEVNKLLQFADNLTEKVKYFFDC